MFMHNQLSWYLSCSWMSNAPNCWHSIINQHNKHNMRNPEQQKSFHLSVFLLFLSNFNLMLRRNENEKSLQARGLVACLLVYSTTHCTEKLPRDGCKQTILSAPWVPPVHSGVRLVLLVYSKGSILVESLSNYIYSSSWIYWKEKSLCLSVS